MNRQIKFRGWDEDNQVMLGPQDLTQSGMYWSWLGKMDVHLMQFTGLQDREGVDVYEGDILRHSFPTLPHRPEFHVVRWDDDKGGFNIADLWLRAHWGVIGNVHEHPDLLTMEEG